MFDRDLFGDPVATAHKSVLAQTFEYPPFSVLNAREGWWQERKRQWLALGIQSEVGRGGQAGETDYARTFGQDLMRGEHIVGTGGTR